ncbi:MAG: LamG domain-containing protein [Planctomycetes bacterium]|nr:LamG domain-containing protein [Planctomycetota bacterium]
MRTKLLCVFGLVSLLGLLASQADAAVLSRWTFDEGTGTTVADSVGNNHGVFVGNPTWEEGVLAGALRVAGRGDESAASFVSCGNDVVKGPDVSVGVWLKKDAVSNCQVIGQSNGNNSTEPGWFIFPRGNGAMWYVINGPEGNWEAGHLRLDGSQGVALPLYYADEWVHLAFTFKDETKELSGYVNGELKASRVINPSRSVIDCPADMRIGRTANGSPNWDGVVDELVIYDHVLTPEEIPTLMEGRIVGVPQAAQPSPEDGAFHEQTFAQLTWLAGVYAASHNIYVGTDAAGIETATEPTAANLAEPNFTIGLPLPGDPYPDGLEYGTTYYWRVDEVNEAHPDSPWKGQVWEFTVVSKEAYNPYPPDGWIDVPADQTLSWLPGFGAETHTVYLGTDANEVANADSGGKVVSEPSYTPAEPLDTGQTYYWRVDEGLTKGDVWSFTTIPDIPVTDETLIGHWKLDGPDAAVMVDSSGHGLHAEVITPGRSVEWIDGVVDGAIRLDGLSDIRTVVDVSSVGVNSNTVTFTAWIRRDIAVGRGWGILQETGRRVGLQLGGGNNVRLNWPGANYASAGLVVAPAQWSFVAAVVEPHQATLYLDGTDNTEVDPTPRDPVVFDRTMEIGTDGSGYNTRFIGALDDLRFYSRALTQEEVQSQIAQAMRINLAWAWNPDPLDGATGISRTPTLSWAPGDYAPPTEGHYVYFGADEPANLALVTTPAQPQTPNSYTPDPLALDTTYYWSVAEANAAADGGVDAGPVWKFTTTDYVVVEDYEPYAPLVFDGPNVYDIWVDGMGDCVGSGNATGANVQSDTGIYLGGFQSIKYEYDNDKDVHNPCTGNPGSRDHFYSKAEAQVSSLPSGIGSDWTIGGARALVLQFQGTTGNAVEDLWVELTDTSDNSAKVLYGAYDDEDPNDVTETSWHEWVMALSDFTGVDVNNVKSIAIGVGTEGASEAGGSGTLYFDDIRLYAPRCILSRREAEYAKVDYAPVGTPGGDCVVNYDELEVMSNDWLLGDANVEPVEPNAALLVAWYKFDGDANDSSGNNRHGTIYGEPWWVAGAPGAADPDGNAIDLDGVDELIDVSHGTIATDVYSIAFWHYPRSLPYTTGYRALMHTDAWSGGAVHLHLGANTSRVSFDWNGGPNVTASEASALVSDQWYHITMIADRTVSPAESKIYIDGVLEGSNTGSASALTLGPFNIGGYRESDRYVNGQFDDFRVYNYALTQNEILHAAGLPTLYIPLVSPANIYDAEPPTEKKVNFKDYAVLSDRWLDEDMFP